MLRPTGALFAEVSLEKCRKKASPLFTRWENSFPFLLFRISNCTEKKRDHSMNGFPNTLTKIQMFRNQVFGFMYTSETLFVFREIVKGTSFEAEKDNVTARWINPEFLSPKLHSFACCTQNWNDRKDYNNIAHTCRCRHRTTSPQRAQRTKGVIRIRSWYQAAAATETNTFLYFSLNERCSLCHTTIPYHTYSLYGSR